MMDRWILTKILHGLSPCDSVTGTFHTVAMDGKKMRVFVDESGGKSILIDENEATQDNFLSMIVGKPRGNTKFFPRQLGDITHRSFAAKFFEEIARENFVRIGHQLILLGAF
jgi:hypothetical protein